MEQCNPLVQLYLNPDYSEITSLWVIHNEIAPKFCSIEIFDSDNENELELNIEEALEKLAPYNVQIWTKNDMRQKGKTFCQSAILYVNNETAFFLSRDIINSYYITFYYLEQPNIKLYNKITKIIKECTHQIEHSKVPQFQLVSSKLEYTTLKINSNKVFNLPEQFNDDFLPINKIIQDWIENTKTNGIAILHGLKGTGKSSYIEYLITTYYKKTFLYVTKETIMGLLSNSLFDLIKSFRNKVVIFEDCEQLIQKRTEYQNNSFISTLLNLSDGILASSCSCKFILTFNCPVSKIDDALLRKGRCVANYEFKELARKKSIELLNSLGKKVDSVPEKGMTLAEIYNYEDLNCDEKPTRKVGFI